ncbi:MAG: hypothetical protein ACQERL_10915 [Bacillota bacterium]|jgi:hypothetical protein
MEIINFIELDEKAEIIKKKDLKNDSNKQVKVPSDDYFKNAEEIIDASGQWLVINELVEIENEYLEHFTNKEEEITWIKLPGKYVEENYMVDYESEDECPLGVDALIKEDGYPIGVITGCDSIKQAKVDNNLDGHKYKGELGIKLNSNNFLVYNQKEEQFKIVKTHTNWDRGKRTI